LVLLAAANLVFICLLIDRLGSSKGVGDETLGQELELDVAGKSPNPDSYNISCPAIDLPVIGGPLINLAEYVGSPILIRFTRMDLREVPHLVFLENVYQKYAKLGLKMFLIIDGRNNRIQDGDHRPDLTIPMVEDQGTIASIFRAYPEETVLVGRDFNIKLKSNELSDNRQLVRFAFGEVIPVDNRPDLGKLRELIGNVRFKNIFSGKIENVQEYLGGEPLLLSLFISTCFTCSESRLLTSMKDLAKEKGGTKLLILFAKGNNINVIREYFINHRLNGIEVGLVEDYPQSEEGSVGLYGFTDNPRVLILNETGRIVLCEVAQLRKNIQDFFLGR
jgi:hypothetical protein